MVFLKTNIDLTCYYSKKKNNIIILFYMYTFNFSVDNKKCQEAIVSILASGLINCPFIWWSSEWQLISCYFALWT